MNQSNAIEILGYKIPSSNLPDKLTLTKIGYCCVNIKWQLIDDSFTNVHVFTDYLPKGQCSADYFINEFNNQLNAILK